MLDAHRAALELEHERNEARRKMAALEDLVAALPSLKQDAERAAIEVIALKQQLDAARKDVESARAEASYMHRRQQLSSTRREIALEQEVAKLKSALQESEPGDRQVRDALESRRVREAEERADRLAALLNERDARIRFLEQQLRANETAGPTAELRRVRERQQSAEDELERVRSQKAEAERECELWARRQESRFSLDLPRREPREREYIPRDTLLHARQKLHTAQRELEAVEARSDSNSRASDSRRRRLRHEG